MASEINIFLFSVMTLKKISESVYVGLCLKIGTPQQVAIRRDVVDFTEFLQHKVARANQYVMMKSDVVDIIELLEHTVARTDEPVGMTSGSQREGFR